MSDDNTASGASKGKFWALALAMAFLVTALVPAMPALAASADSDQGSGAGQSPSEFIGPAVSEHQQAEHRVQWAPDLTAQTERHESMFDVKKSPVEGKRQTAASSETFYLPVQGAPPQVDQTSLSVSSTEEPSSSGIIAAPHVPNIRDSSQPAASGRAALRETKSSPILASYPGPVTSSPSDVLIVSAEDSVGPLSMELLARPNINSVDWYDARSATPLLGDLTPYDVVICFSDYYWGDPNAMGDVLADYVDAGGKIIMATFCWYPGDTIVGGRFLADGYAPLNSQDYDNHFSTSTLGTYDETPS